METGQTVVQRQEKRHWTPKKKLEIIEQWRAGLPIEELCRWYRVGAAQIYKWKRDAEQELKERAEMVPSCKRRWTN